jgi:hypothetical protein
MQQSISIDENEGWEFYHKLNNTSQLALGINKRFYMLLNGADVSLDELHELLALLSFSEFPDQNVDFTTPKTR